MKELYGGKLVCFILSIGLVAGCGMSEQTSNREKKDVCETTEECTQIGDKTLQKVYKKIDGLSELEVPEDYVMEQHTNNDMKEAEMKKEDDENYFFLASYYIDGDEIIEPYFDKLDRTRLNKAFSDDKDAKEEVLKQRKDRDYHESLWEMYSTLIPAQYRTDIKEFDMVTDGYDGIVAHVMPSREYPKEWTISLDTLDSAVNIDQVMKTLIHETAHVLTLGHKQIPVNEKYLQAFEEDKDISSYQNKCKSLFYKKDVRRKALI
jgi:hypothetical protein